MTSRIIFYLVDGVSAVKVRSFNELDQQKFKTRTYFDEIYEEGHVFQYCYGYDTTQNSFYAIDSGQTLYETEISRSQKWRLDVKSSFFNKLKQVGYRLHFFSNNCSLNIALPYSYFDKIKFRPYIYDLNDSDLDKKFFGLGADKTVLFIHDLYTHDQRGEYVLGKFHLTHQEYENLIKEQAVLLKKNLKFLKFNKKKDLLVVFSDHGLTVGTKITPKSAKFLLSRKRFDRWFYPGTEIKSRVMFIMVNSKIKPFINKNVCSLVDAFDHLAKFLGIKDYKSSEYQRFNFHREAITANFGVYPRSIFSIIKKRIFNERFYQFVFVKGHKKFREKWIYQLDLNKGVYFDLAKDPYEENPIEVKFSELPKKMKIYINKYQNSRPSWVKIALFKISDFRAALKNKALFKKAKKDYLKLLKQREQNSFNF